MKIPVEFQSNGSARQIILHKVKQAEDKSEWRAEELRDMVEDFCPDVKNYGADQNYERELIHIQD